jgi:hypothetical protein
MTKARDLANSTAARDTNLSGFTDTFTLPTTDGTNGQSLTTNGSGVLSFASPASFSYTLGTAVSPTSSTAIDFTGIPSTAKRITLILSEVGATAYLPGNLRFRIGDSGGIETTGYGTGTNTNYGSTSLTALFTDSWSLTAQRFLNGPADDLMSGALTLTKLTGNTWAAAGSISVNGTNAPSIFLFSGAKTLSDTLDRVRLDWTGSGTFGSGTINISYEV